MLDYQNSQPRAGVIALNQNGHILLVQDAVYGKWGFPKGKADSGERDFKKVAQRELKEENTPVLS